MELGDWILLAVVLTPMWAGLGYGLLRLLGRTPPAEGVPPGRRGGMGRVGPAGVPLSDAAYYGREQEREEGSPDDG